MSKKGWIDIDSIREDSLRAEDNLKLERGTQIIYVPTHAEGDVNHPDCEEGFVSSVSPDGEYAWCRYWNKLFPRMLRTRANSEKTSVGDLVIKKTRDQSLVEKALEDYCT